jgi:lipopolysaccharide export system permease protein
VKRLHWTLLRALPLPFAAAFLTLMFLLVMQFLIRYLPDLVGRGLPVGVLAELVAYSLAYMVTLAVPMAWMIAMLAAFGRMSESRAYLVVKSAGISLGRLAWPVLVAGALLTAGMVYFNNEMLPEANHRMNMLMRDIRVARPGFALEPGVFYTGVDGYAIRAERIPPDSTGLLEGVTVFQSRTPSGGQGVLTAARARLQTQYGGQRLTMLLEDGEVHLRSDGDRYERLAFARHRMAFDLSSLGGFERREADGSRTDRTMRSSEMLALVDSLDRAAQGRTDSVAALFARLGRPAAPDAFPTARVLLPTDTAGAARAPVRIGPHRAVLDPLPDPARAAVYDVALDRVRTARAAADAAMGSAQWERQRADRYRVEIYKKNSIALACLIFVLIGVPLGLAMSRAGVGLVASLAVFTFLFYWVTLVQGEKLADRGLLPPWLGMWAANVIVGVLGVYLVLRESRDPAWRDPIRALAGRFSRRS